MPIANLSHYNNMKKTVVSLCEGRYEVLKEYIADTITVSDLADFDEEELTDCVQSKHKLLMRLFFKKVLLPLIGPNQDPFEHYEESHSPSAEYAKAYKEGVIAYRGRVISAVRASQYEGFTLPAYSHYVQNLPDEIAKTYANRLDKCIVLDLSQNDLLAEDGEHILKCVSLLPNCNFVDLKVNRIMGIPTKIDWIPKLADYPSVKFIRIVFNVIASAEYPEFWKQLDKYTKEDGSNNLVEKLIWIPPQWVNRKEGGWNSMVDKKFIPKIIETHNEFYKEWTEW